MQNLLLEDPHYFSDLSYDEIVTAATNVLLLADSVFPYQRRGDDEVGPAAGRYSEIRGVHTMEFAEGVVSSFQKNFNDMVDEHRPAKKAGDEKAGLLRKDKARPLQFIPGIHIFEQGLAHLLSLAGVEADQCQNLSAEDLVRKVGSINPEMLLKDFKPSSVPPEASQQSVDAAFSLSRWFQGRVSANAPQKLSEFRVGRLCAMDLPQPSPTAFAEKLQKAGGRRVNQSSPRVVVWKLGQEKRAGIFSLAQAAATLVDPANTFLSMDRAATSALLWTPALLMWQCDLLLLALIGLIAVGHGSWAKVKYPQEDEGFLLAANRLQLFSPDSRGFICKCAGCSAPSAGEAAARPSCQH